MGDSLRVKRVSEVILSCLAEEIRRLSDPRLELLTLTGVKLSPDLKRARVYWSAYRPMNPKQLEDVQAALSGSAKMLQKRLAELAKLRYTPLLVFEYDISVANGNRIEELLQEVKPGSSSR